MSEQDEYEVWRNLSEGEIRSLYNSDNWRNLSKEELRKMYDHKAYREALIENGLIGIHR